MRSQSRATREDQKKAYDQLIQKRRADLEMKGLTPKVIEKDSVYAHLRAKRRAIINAIAAIDASDARNVRQKEAVVEPAAPEPAPAKEKKPKKAKAAPAK